MSALLFSLDRELANSKLLKFATVNQLAGCAPGKTFTILSLHELSHLLYVKTRDEEDSESECEVFFTQASLSYLT